MKRYGNRSGDAGVRAYDYGPDWILIQFARDQDEAYEYRRAQIGAANFREMKRLADSGDGLTTFINTHPEVKTGYSAIVPIAKARRRKKP